MNNIFENLIMVCVYFNTWAVTDTLKEAEFCGERKPVLRFCNDGQLSDTSAVFVDTASAQPFYQNPCQCTISSAHRDIYLLIKYADISNGSNAKNFQFAINDVFLNSSVSHLKTRLINDSKIVFTTRWRNVKGGVCLQIDRDPNSPSSLDEEKTFNVTCAGQTSLDFTEDYDSRTSHAVPIVLSVTGALLFISGAVIILVAVKRYRLAQKTKFRINEDHAPLSSEHSTTQGQGRQTYVSGVEHYLKMSDNIKKINKSEKRSGYRSSMPLNEEEESYEMIAVCKNYVEQNIASGQGRQNTRSHIYENTRSQPMSRSNSETFEKSTSNM